MKRHSAWFVPVVVATAACGSPEDASTPPGRVIDDASVAPRAVKIVGDVLPFLSEVGGPRVEGAKITVLELPEKSVVTGADAHFELDGIPVGSEVTLVLEHPDFHTTQTATVRVGEHGVNPFTIQALSKPLFQALSGLVPTPLDETKYCAIATTVTRSGGSLFVHLRQGEPGVSVSLAPSVDAASGPIYFNESVLPDVNQPSTSKDGGVVFVNVPPGEYTISGEKAGLVFQSAKVKCRAGIVVNAGPPLGVLAHVVNGVPGTGATYPDDDYSAATDALCAKTAACVNEKAADEYPPAQEASCRAMFKDALSFVDPGCDTDAAFRNSWRTLFECRARNCDLALGGDTACAPEDAAFVSAMEAYGRCLGAKQEP